MWLLALPACPRSDYTSKTAVSSFDGTCTLNYTITEQLRWQGPLDPPGPMRAEAGPPSAGCPGMCPGGFRSPRKEAGQDPQSKAWPGCTATVFIAEVWRHIADAHLLWCYLHLYSPQPLQTWCLPGFPTQAWGFFYGTEGVWLKKKARDFALKILIFEELDTSLGETIADITKCLQPCWSLKQAVISCTVWLKNILNGVFNWFFYCPNGQHE